MFVDYDYLLCSEVFVTFEYYIIKAYEDNFEHLTGVSSNLKAMDFFKKCYDGTLNEDDFSFYKKNNSFAKVKGAVRDKIIVLPDISQIFSSATMVEEEFHQNAIACSFAAESTSFTMGFICKGFSKPKTLLRGRALNSSRSGSLELVLRRKRGMKKFNKIIVGNNEVLCKYLAKIHMLLSDELLSAVNFSNGFVVDK